jgi:hypothetical protein
MEQILEKKLEILNVCYLEKTTKEMLPPIMVVTCISTSNGNVERPLEDQKVNTTY